MNKKWKILIFLFILLGFMIGLGVVFYLSRNIQTNFVETTEDIKRLISSPASYLSDIQHEEKSDSISFDLQFASIDMRNPYIDVYLKFNSLFEGNVKTELASPARYLIYNNDFTLIVQTGGEGLPVGLETPIPEYKRISNLLNKDIDRVEYSKDLNVQTLFKTTNQNRQFLYFYSDSFQYGLECGPGYEGYFCGGDSIRLEPLKDGNKLSYRIYCGVDNTASVKYCDQIMNNLQISVNDLRE